MIKLFNCISLCLLLIACSKTEVTQNQIVADNESFENLSVNPEFHFQTSYDVTLKLSTLDNLDMAVPNVRINILTELPEKGGQLIASFTTDNNGYYEGVIRIPTTYDSLVLETKVIGFVNLLKRKVIKNTLEYTFGGMYPSTSSAKNISGTARTNNTILQRTMATPPIKTIGSYNLLGVPNYLIIPNDVIDISFLNDVNTALPENRPVPTYHPEYLNQTSQANLEFQLPSKVWVTFLHEGAGYKNVLCYYKYKINQPPTSVNEIDTLYAIFPNISFANSGGGLVSGNKVTLGTFMPGEAIGWAIIANGYNGSSITQGAGVYYSNSNLNPEINVALKKHCILLNDMNRDKLLLSFEDLNREGSCDNDFNDAIFYVTANPIQAINTNNIALPAYTTIDTDRDGVMDNFDDYPNDPTKAFDNYYPSQNTVGTLAFEDLWPSLGDYDFNDMVIDYNFNPVTNSRNEVTQIKANITVKAIGASYHNGFGIQLPVSPNLIASVTGTNIKGNLIRKNANGTESNQTKATIIVFDDAFNELPWPGGSFIGVNTSIGAPYVQPKTLQIVITFNTPVNVSSLGLPPYNAFIFINGNRSKEVHLINKPPTDLANYSLLGSQADNSIPTSGRYYVTAKNLPFAIDIFGPFEYVTEKSKVTQGHLNFYNWASSNGATFNDWYKPLSNYRDNTKIFRK